jgi:formate hydrogenlyase subunit 3/multisubunit Na+/H+ antiporter MnhD subunit
MQRPARRCRRCTVPLAGLRKVFFGLLPEHFKDKDLKDPPLTMSIPLYLVAAGSICLGLYPKIIMDLLHAVIGG